MNIEQRLDEIIKDIDIDIFEYGYSGGFVRNNIDSHLKRELAIAKCLLKALERLDDLKYMGCGCSECEKKSLAKLEEYKQEISRIMEEGK